MNSNENGDDSFLILQLFSQFKSQVGNYIFAVFIELKGNNKNSDKTNEIVTNNSKL